MTDLRELAEQIATATALAGEDASNDPTAWREVVDDIETDLQGVFHQGLNAGGAIIFGLIGMAEGIRYEDLSRWLRLTGWVWSEEAEDWVEAVGSRGGEP